MAQVKAKDIARQLNLSPAAVSLVLNDKPGVSEATRQQVFNLLKEWGCEEMMPQRSQPARHNIVLIIYRKHDKTNLSYDEHAFFSQMMEGVNTGCRKHGYNLLVTYVNGQADPSAQLNHIDQDSCDGIIVLATEMFTTDLAIFNNTSLPLVVLDSYFERFKYDCVVINNVQGAYEATNYLAHCGHSQIGYLKSSFDINNFAERFEGYQKALRINNLVFDPDQVLVVGSSIESAYQATKALLARKIKLPTAFFAENDLLALGAVKAFKEAGYKIPNDISVVGFDNLALTTVFEPPLTTIHVPKERLGMLAVDRLVSRINESVEEFVKIEIGTTLVERGSVKTIA